jgi:hypothetical protein
MYNKSKKNSWPDLDTERFVEITDRIATNPGKPQSRKVEEVLELLSALGNGVDKREKMQTIARLNRLLRGCQWTARVSSLSAGLHVSFVTAPGRLTDDDRWGHRAISYLLGIVPYLDRPRITRCGNAKCPAWLFTVKGKTRKFCDNNVCKQYAYDSNPDIRKRKSLYMKERYAASKQWARNRNNCIGLWERKRD